MPKNPTKISALLITFNERHNIDAVLENLGFADEIIVVDSFSTDGTIERIKTRPKVTLIQRPFLNYTDQKSYALAQATHDWVLFLDADERLTPQLKKEVLEVVASDAGPVAYFFLRTFMFKNKVLRFSGWQSDKNYRLFRKSKVQFVQHRIVHETLQVNGTSATLKNRLLHYSYTDYEEYKGKMLKYGKMKAQEEHAKGKKARFFHFIFRPMYKFINHFVIRLGFLDGKRGAIISYLNALGVLARYREMKRLQTTKKPE
ncbi:Glycosyl transferase, family 2 protein [Croceitalea dokdonensis DOKDO 023]|uniref:Glycosyl transferase, family 2 protein n=1 Tax=Croceitalea dokdonensis DOKDO 023 TaxID=1300341 RepID=A0A0P7A542_9FLAO|nr:glycosyltransferase family 2 protein [Croceitalea dokdonensis]KPM31616.1 Glycosyl transferase, family 2 protein [Croceitalea dokdonensis DOKDO 023]